MSAWREVGDRIEREYKVERPRSVMWRGMSIISERDPLANGRYHLSVGAEGHKPTDAQVQTAINEWAPPGIRLVEEASVVNPWVRHFFEHK